MKHHIVIYRGNHLVENMMSSKIATPKELRARLTKKYPGKYKLYFRTIDSQHGWFSNKRGVYDWFIDSDSTKRQKKPNAIPDKRIIRSKDPITLNLLTGSHPYGIYENDVFSIPPFEEAHCMRQSVHPDHPDTYIYYVEALVNGYISWLSLNDLRMFEDSPNMYEALKRFAGKKIRVTKAIAKGRCPRIVDVGLLTGKPISWWLMPITRPHKQFEYEIV